MRTSFNAALCILILGTVSACAVEGPPESRGTYSVVDMHADLGSVGGSAALAAPAGWKPAPNLLSPNFPVAAPVLFAAMQDILAAQPRTWLVSAHPEQNQAIFIVRSRAMNMPDIVIVQAVPAGEAASQAVIFSHSRFDVNPFSSVNQDRVRGLIQILTRRFNAPPNPGQT